MNKPTAVNPMPPRGEIASSRDGRDITAGYLDPLMIQPSRDPILRDHGLTLEAYEAILQDDQVAATFQQRRLAVTSAEWDVRAGGSDRQSVMAADFLRENLDRIGWDAVTDKMLYGVFYGYAVAECMWARDGGHIVLEALKVRKQRRFGFDGTGRLRMMTMENPNGELMPDRKFWHYATGSDNDDEPYGLGLARWLYWPVFFKRNGVKLWLIFLDKFGMPTAKGSFPTGATLDEQRRLLQAAQTIQTDSAICLPEGMNIELIEASRGGQPTYHELLRIMNGAIAKVVLSQALTTESVGGQYKAEVQMDVRREIVRADSDMITTSFNGSVVRWLMAMNFPKAALPQAIRITQEPEDLTERSKRDKTIVEMGFRPDLEYIKQTYGDGWSDATPTTTSTKPDTTNKTEFAEPNPTTPLTADLYTRQAMEQASMAMTTLLDPIKAMLATVDLLTDARDRLFDLYPTMKSDPLTQLLTGATVAADLLGRHEVVTESEFNAEFADLVLYKSLPFKEAIDFFRGKLNIPTERWDDLLDAAHDVGFMVAGATKADLLADLRGALDQAIVDGTTIESFRKNFDQAVEDHGWAYNGSRAWRTRTIFETNIWGAYNAGRYTQMTDPDLLKSRPYWQYKHSGSLNPRQAHLAWNGLILPADDPWWQSHYPSNGWGCKCRVFSLAPRDLHRMGRGIDSAPAGGNEGIDRGFAHAPGATREQTRGQIADKVKLLPPKLANALRSELDLP